MEGGQTVQGGAGDGGEGSPSNAVDRGASKGVIGMRRARADEEGSESPPRDAEPDDNTRPVKRAHVDAEAADLDPLQAYHIPADWDLDTDDDVMRAATLLMAHANEGGSAASLGQRMTVASDGKWPWSCRSVEEFEKLNRIDEGAYGVVYRAKDTRTNQVVALKKIKFASSQSREGFPITSLREIRSLMALSHEHIVCVHEVAVGAKAHSVYMVMEFLEHDMKDLMQDMLHPFSPAEVKCDLKTSNLLMNNRGMLKVADFGMARYYGSPLAGYTRLVVTLWYRCPELLLGADTYSTAVDMWSVGCIFAEFLTNKPLLPGKGEIDQLGRIFNLLGVPTESMWPGFQELPHVKRTALPHQPYNNLRNRFPGVTSATYDLLHELLKYNPERRISAADALKHEYFRELPRAKDPSMMPTWPSGNEGRPRRAHNSPRIATACHAEEEEATLFSTKSVDTHALLRGLKEQERRGK